MNAIDSAIMANLTGSEAINGIIANTPGIVDCEKFISMLATRIDESNQFSWHGSERSVAMFKALAGKPGIEAALKKTALYKALKPYPDFDWAELFMLAIERIAAEPDSEYADIWLTVAAKMLSSIDSDNDMPL